MTHALIKYARGSFDWHLVLDIDEYLLLGPAASLFDIGQAADRQAIADGYEEASMVVF